MGDLYRSKPQDVEAIQWTGDNYDDVLAFVSPGDREQIVYITNQHLETAPHDLMLTAGAGGSQGFVPVPVGHWIVRKVGDLSDHWPVDPEYFADKYEKVRG